MKPFDPTKITDGVRVDTSALRRPLPRTWGATVRCSPETWRRVVAGEVLSVSLPGVTMRRRLTWWQRWRWLVVRAVIFAAGVLAGWVATTW